MSSIVRKFTNNSLPKVLEELILAYFPVNENVYLAKNKTINVSLEEWYEIYLTAKNETKLLEDSKKVIPDLNQWKGEYKRFVEKYSEYPIKTDFVDFFVEQYTDSTVGHYTYGSELYFIKRSKLLEEVKTFYTHDKKIIKYLEGVVENGLGDISNSDDWFVPPLYNGPTGDSKNIILFGVRGRKKETYDEIKERFYTSKEIEFYYDTHQYYVSLADDNITDWDYDRKNNENYWIYWLRQHGKKTKIETIKIGYQGLEDVLETLPLDRKTRPPNLIKLIVETPTLHDLQFIVDNRDTVLGGLQIELLDTQGTLEQGLDDDIFVDEDYDIFVEEWVQLLQENNIQYD